MSGADGGVSLDRFRDEGPSGWDLEGMSLGDNPHLWTPRQGRVAQKV